MIRLCALVALLLASRHAAAEVERYAVVVGANVGSASDVTLRYAETDATRVYDVLKDLGGFRAENMLLLRGDDADTVRRAIIAMNDRIRARAGPSVLLVYYSGHADAQSLHVGSTPLPLLELEPLVRSSAASFRLLVLDACRSGALTRVKGGTSAPAFAIRVDERLAGEGAVFLTSSAANEDAQESDELGGSFFTHFLVSGLLGAADTDGDGRVALGEVYRYAYTNTLRETSGTLAGPQHPTFRYELKGEGELTLTSLSARERSRAIVSFPPGRDYLVFLGTPQGGVAAEVAATDRVRRLSLRPGHYFVRARGSDHLLEGELEVMAGRDQTISESGLRRVEYARLVRKGSVLHRVDGIEAGTFVRSPILDGQSPCWGGYGAYVVELERLSLRARVGGCSAGFANDTLAAEVAAFTAEFAALHVWDLSRFSFDVAVSVGGTLLYQSFTTRGTAPDRTTGAGLLGVSVGASAELGLGFSIGLELGAQTLFFRGLSGGEEAVAAHVGATLHAGIGKRW